MGIKQISALFILFSIGFTTETLAGRFGFNPFGNDNDANKRYQSSQLKKKDSQSQASRPVTRAPIKKNAASKSMHQRSASSSASRPKAAPSKRGLYKQRTKTARSPSSSSNREKRQVLRQQRKSLRQQRKTLRQQRKTLRQQRRNDSKPPFKGSGTRAPIHLRPERPHAIPKGMNAPTDVHRMRRR